MAFASKYHEVADLHVRSAALTFEDGPQAKIALMDQLEALASFDIPKIMSLNLNPVYNGHEELSGLFLIGENEADLFWLAAAHIAMIALQESAAVIYEMTPPSLAQFLDEYGSDAAALLCDLTLEAAHSAAPQYRRCEVTNDEDGTIYAPLNTNDHRFEEGQYVRCEAADAGATLVTWMAFDADLYANLLDVLGQKVDAALKATRAPVEPA